MSTSRPYTPKPATQARLVAKQAARIYPEDPGLQAQFTDCVVAGQANLPTLFWLDEPPVDSMFRQPAVTTWQPDWVTTLAVSDAGRDPLHQQGAYYLLDFSSIISASVLLSIKTPVATILDLCAAPGGKGIFAWRLLQPELLISNEVIGKRAGMLIANLKRCQVKPSVVTRLDPAQIAAAAPGSFDVVLVDAPCSGQSLIAKGEIAAGAFQPNLIAGNMTRQRRILANAGQSVAPGGYLAYMTCTYSREENEKNVEWLLRRFPQFEAIEVSHLADLRSELADFPCYRYGPQDGLGVGGFTALLRDTTTGRTQSLNLKSLRPIWESE